jgi:hypothetical protein
MVMKLVKQGGKWILANVPDNWSSYAKNIVKSVGKDAPTGKPANIGESTLKALAESAARKAAKTGSTKGTGVKYQGDKKVYTIDGKQVRKNPTRTDKQKKTDRKQKLEDQLKASSEKTAIFRKAYQEGRMPDGKKLSDAEKIMKPATPKKNQKGLSLAGRGETTKRKSGGAVYRGRSYAYGGRVAKYKG